MALESSSNLSLPRLLRGYPAFRNFVVIRVIDELCSQMVNVAIVWHVYAMTHNPMSLAFVGLTQFLPNIGMALITGHAADRFDRRKIAGFSFLVQVLCAAVFVVLFAIGSQSVGSVYLLLVLIGSARAFASPAMSAMLPHLVSGEEFPRAAAVTSSAFQIFAIAGPALGGFIYTLSACGLFATVAALYCAVALLVFRLPVKPDMADASWSHSMGSSILGGFRYVWSNRLLLALTSLDLFAVLLGGITALLPIYAKDILAVGPVGLGCLRCAPGLGSAVVGIVLAHRTIQRGVGKLMLAGVAGFGLATITFALSTHFWLSFAALIGLGGFDMVSMVIRQTLVQISTPDSMRGRVSAVNGVFISASSELGEFESGVTAALFGAIPAALLGGVGTLLIAALWVLIFPELPRADKLIMDVTEHAASG
jgi:MFS family permease